MNQGYSYTEIIPPWAEGKPVLAYLADRYRHSLAEEWAARLQAGLVKVNEQSVQAADRLAPGQRLTWIRPPWEEPDAPLAWAVLFEDQDLLAVAKPSGLPTLPGGGFLEHTLLKQVQQRFPEANPIHRLGRATSGVVLFARSDGAANRLSNALQQHRMEKVYRALVVGHPAEDVFEVNVPIGPIPHPTLGTVHGASTGGKRARSSVQVLERRAATTLVEVQIETGRPHQIRIHMAAAGFPLWGDPLYASGGGLLGEGLAVPGDPGYLLHALRITLPHPRTGETITIRCQPPPQLR
ncbi:MAG: RluA family pseudouridine synthase [Holophaga sp.]|nr:RluA family pseudouridine synthase [Holophaga sp.]